MHTRIQLFTNFNRYPQLFTKRKSTKKRNNVNYTAATTSLLKLQHLNVKIKHPMTFLLNLNGDISTYLQQVCYTG